MDTPSLSMGMIRVCAVMLVEEHADAIRRVADALGGAATAQRC